MGSRPLSQKVMNEYFHYDHIGGALYNRITRRRAKEKEMFGSVLQRRRNSSLMGMVDGEFYVAQDICWAMYTGEWPDGEIQHKNGDTSDNRITNLHIAYQAFRDPAPSAQFLEEYRRSEEEAARVAARVKKYYEENPDRVRKSTWMEVTPETIRQDEEALEFMYERHPHMRPQPEEPTKPRSPELEELYRQFPHLLTGSPAPPLAASEPS
jgi:hypothetical protein